MRVEASSSWEIMERQCMIGYAVGKWMLFVGIAAMIESRGHWRCGVAVMKLCKSRMDKNNGNAEVEDEEQEQEQEEEAGRG